MKDATIMSPSLGGMPAVERPFPKCADEMPCIGEIREDNITIHPMDSNVASPLPAVEMHQQPDDALHQQPADAFVMVVPVSSASVATDDYDTVSKCYEVCQSVNGLVRKIARLEINSKIISPGATIYWMAHLSFTPMEWCCFQNICNMEMLDWLEKEARIIHTVFGNTIIYINSMVFHNIDDFLGSLIKVAHDAAW